MKDLKERLQGPTNSSFILRFMNLSVHPDKPTSKWKLATIAQLANFEAQDLFRDRACSVVV
jgi:hypothetical protein